MCLSEELKATLMQASFHTV